MEAHTLFFFYKFFLGGMIICISNIVLDFKLANSLSPVKQVGQKRMRLSQKSKFLSFIQKKPSFIHRSLTKAPDLLL